VCTSFQIQVGLVDHRLTKLSGVFVRFRAPLVAELRQP
jgi:hypothetical protein